MLLTPADPRLGFFAPQQVDRRRAEARLDRFPPVSAQLLAGQIGPLANLRSSSGCAVVLVTDAAWVELRLERLRHHQLVPQGIAAEIEHPEGLITVASEDLREREGSVVVRLATGMSPGMEPVRVWLWLPTISTVAVGGVLVPDDCRCLVPEIPEPRWLAIGDSLTQGFSLQVPTQTWVHRCARAWGLPAWNLGVGGIHIEPAAFAWALAARRWRLVTIALGSNHSWRAGDADPQRVAGLARDLADLALAGGHEQVVWILPPWKPCEEGRGPVEFAGLALDRAAGERAEQVRECLRDTLAAYGDAITVVGDLGVKDHRFYPDGLHPFAIGFRRYADALMQSLIAAKTKG